MATVYPGAAFRPCANQSGPMSAHLGMVLHVQVGTNDLGAEFNDPNSQASYTWVAYADGHLDQFVDADMTAWAQGQGNGTYNSCGTQGFPEDPLTEAACQTIAALYRWGHDLYGWPYQLAEQPGDPGFGWHGMGGQAWGGHESCPGDLRRNQRQHILDLAQGTPTGGFLMALSDQQQADLYSMVEGLVAARDAADADKDPAGKPMTDHWTLVWMWNKVQQLVADVAAIKAKLGA